MSSEDLQDALRQLSKGGLVQLREMTQSASFDNMLILMSISDLDLRLIRDRGTSWCELLVPGPPAKWFFFDDVMNAIGVPFASSAVDLVGTLEATINHFQQHQSEILEAFKAEHVVRTGQKVQEIVKQRVHHNYGFTPNA